MRIYGEVPHREVVDLVCDRCGRQGSDEPNGFETQAFLSYHTVAGYASIFGDMNFLNLDLCQHCMKDVIGEWLRVTEVGSSEFE